MLLWLEEDAGRFGIDSCRIFYFLVAKLGGLHFSHLLWQLLHLSGHSRSRGSHYTCASTDFSNAPRCKGSVGTTLGSSKKIKTSLTLTFLRLQKSHLCRLSDFVPGDGPEDPER